MHDLSTRTLGKTLFWAGFRLWSFALLFCFAAWEAGKHFPLVGIVLIGTAPFVALFCFFRGLTAFRRHMTATKTRRKAKELGLVPTWSIASGGFLLLDDTRGLWAGNGSGGTFNDLDRLICVNNEHSYILELWTTTSGQPQARIGLDSTIELKQTADHVQKAATPHRAAPLDVFFDEQHPQINSDSKTT